MVLIANHLKIKPIGTESQNNFFDIKFFVLYFSKNFNIYVNFDELIQRRFTRGFEQN